MVADGETALHPDQRTGTMFEVTMKVAQVRTLDILSKEYPSQMRKTYRNHKLFGPGLRSQPKSVSVVETLYTEGIEGVQSSLQIPEETTQGDKVPKPVWKLLSL